MHADSGQVQRAVYVSGRGQVDNLGDSVLRRPYLAALRGAGRLHVLLEPESAAYTANLGLTDEDVLFTSTKEWWRALLRASLSDRVLLAYNAGEMQTSGRLFIRNVAFAATSLANRRRAGARVHMGCSIRSQNRWSRPTGRTLASSAVLTWRDPESRAWAGTGSVAPDWAFLEGTPDGDPALEQPRDLLAVSFRGDRAPIGAEIVAAIKDVAARRGLRPLVCIQVRRDADEARRLAGLLDADLLDWASDRSHAEQEHLVRAAYRRSRAVLSDRVHALIIGATEGAVPIGLDLAAAGKLDRTFRGAGFAPVSVDVGERSTDEIETALLARIDALTSPSAAVATARVQLRTARDRLHAALPAR